MNESKPTHGGSAPPINPLVDSVWTRAAARAADPPSETTRKPALRREQIVAAAIELLDTEGIAGLSMRRLAARLDAGTTSTYWYVKNRGELLDLAFDEALSEVPAAAENTDTPDTDGATWRDQLERYATGLLTTLTRHPWMVSVVGQRPNIGPRSTQLTETLLGVLTAAGFSLRDSAHAASGLTAYVLGSAVAQAARHTMQLETGLSADQLNATLSDHFRSQRGANPNIGQWIDDTTAIDIDTMQNEIFHAGLQRHLDGLTLHLGDRTKKSRRA